MPKRSQTWQHTRSGPQSVGCIVLASFRQQFCMYCIYLYIFRMYFVTFLYICYILTHHGLTHPIYPSEKSLYYFLRGCPTMQTTFATSPCGVWMDRFSRLVNPAKRKGYIPKLSKTYGKIYSKSIPKYIQIYTNIYKIYKI